MRYGVSRVYTYLYSFPSAFFCVRRRTSFQVVSVAYIFCSFGCRMCLFSFPCVCECVCVDDFCALHVNTTFIWHILRGVTLVTQDNKTKYVVCAIRWSMIAVVVVVGPFGMENNFSQNSKNDYYFMLTHVHGTHHHHRLSPSSPPSSSIIQNKQMMQQSASRWFGSYNALHPDTHTNSSKDSVI